MRTTWDYKGYIILRGDNDYRIITSYDDVIQIITFNTLIKTKKHIDRLKQAE